MDINLIENMNVKKVSVMKVTAALKENGYLLDEPNPETGKTRKVPSAKGKNLGIKCFFCECANNNLNY